MLPNDARFTGSWGVLNLLVHKIMAALVSQQLLRSANIYYHEIDEVKPEALLLLTAHTVQDGLLRADISSPKGSLIASAYALCHSPQGRGQALGKPLGSPITFSAAVDRRTESEPLESYFGA